MVAVVPNDTTEAEGDGGLMMESRLGFFEEALRSLVILMEGVSYM